MLRPGSTTVKPLGSWPVMRNPADVWLRGAGAKKISMQRRRCFLLPRTIHDKRCKSGDREAFHVSSSPTSKRANFSRMVTRSRLESVFS